MTELTSLYDFRVSNSIVTLMKPTRYQSAAQIVSWHNQGFNGQLKAEKKVNGEWVLDPETFTLAEKREQKNKSKKTTVKTSEKEVTVKSSVAKIVNIGRILSSTDNVTQAHIDAMQDAINTFKQAVHAHPDYTLYTENDVESEEGDTEEEDENE